jgi:hypothetical protein
MRQLIYAGLVAGHIVLVLIYWLGSQEPAGTAMLALFGVAMGVLVWIVVRTANDVGPTAPVDDEWHERA